MIFAFGRRVFWSKIKNSVEISDTILVRNTFRILFTIPIFLLISQSSFAFNEGPQTFTLDGQLFSNTGMTVPLLDASASVKVQILNPAGTCILYEETQSVNTLSSNGYFNILVGSETGSIKRTGADSNTAMARIFQNWTSIPGVSAPSQTCASATYTPIPGDSRLFRLIVTPTAGVAETLTPDMTLDAVPMAIVAQSVQGLERANILQVNTTAPADLSQTNLESIFNTTQLPKLNSLLSGSSAQYVARSTTAGVGMPSYTTASPPSTPTAGSMWYDSTAGEMRYFDGSNVKSVGSGAVTGSSLANGKIWVGDGSSQAAAVSLSGDATLTNAGVLNLASGILRDGGNSTGAAISAGTTDAFGFSLKTGGTTRMTFDTAGNVGIGTTTPAASLHLGGNRSASAWTTSGIGIRQDTATYTDTSSSGSVLNTSVNVLAQPTLAASAATTYTRASTLLIPNAPASGANVSITNAFGLDVNTTSRLAGKVIFGGGQSLSTATSLVNISAGGGVLSTPSWTTTGVMSATLPAIVTDTTGSGTIAARTSNSLAQPTFASTSAVTLTNASTFYIENAPAAGTNTTITNPLALQVAAGMSAFGGNVGIGTTSPNYLLESRSNVLTNNTEVITGAFTGPGLKGVLNGYATDGAGAIRESRIRSAGSIPLSLGTTNSNSTVYILDSGNVGIGTIVPATTLDLNGALSFRGMATPALSPAGQGRIYFDSTANTFQVSQNGGAYSTLATTGGAGGGQTSTTSMTYNSNSDASGGDGGFSFQSGASNLMTIANNGDTVFSSTTSSTSNSTGAVVISGGLGVGGQLNALALTSSGSNTNTYSSSGATTIPVGANGGPTLLTKNTANVDTSGAFHVLQVNNTTPSAQRAYIGAISTTGAVFTPAVVFGQQTGSASYQERMRIDSNGYVGIGTATPAYSLHVDKSSAPAMRVSSSGVAYLDFGGATSGGQFSASSAAGDGVIRTLSGNLLLSSQTAAGNINFSTGTTDSIKMSILSGGNVGIGTTSPARLLHIAGPIRMTASAVPASPATGDLYIDSGDSNKLKWYDGSGWQAAGGTGGSTQWTTAGANIHFSTGNVGIGSSSPTAPLDVVGDVKSTSAFYAPVSYIAKNLAGTNNAAGPAFSFVYSSDTGMYEADSAGSHALAFSSAGSERMRISSTGNVGIGTSNPATLLEVRKDQAGSSTISKVTNLATTNGTQARLDLATGTANSYGILSISENGAGANSLELSSGDGVSNGMFFTTGSSSTNIPMIFRQGASERMRISSTGNVGIGTTNPLTILQLDNGDGGGENFRSFRHVGSNPWSNISRYYQSRGTASVPAATANGDFLVSFNMGGYDGTAYQDSASLAAVTDGAISSGVVPGAFVFYTGSSGGGSERMRISSSGNVGIGTTTPQRLLHINGPMRIQPAALPGSPAAGDLAIDSGASNSLKYYDGGTWVSANGGSLAGYERVNSSGTVLAAGGTGGVSVTCPGAKVAVGGGCYANAASVNVIQSYASANQTWSCGFTSASGGAATIWAYAVCASSGADSPEWSTISGNVVNSNAGNVGIGTTTPGNPLEVQGIPLTGGFTGTSVGVLAVSGDAYTVNDIVAMDFKPNNQGSDAMARIGMLMTGSGSYLQFGTSNNYASGITNTAMSIDYAGNVGIGITAPGSYKLYVQGGMARLAGGLEVHGLSFDGTGNYVCRNTTTGEITYSSSACSASDERLKEKISDLPSSLDRILGLRPVNYFWKDQKQRSPAMQIGFIAQEVQKIYPEVVQKNENGFLSLDYAPLIAPLVKAFQELYQKLTGAQANLQKQVDLQKEKIEAMKKENDVLKARLEKIEASLKSK